MKLHQLRVEGYKRFAKASTLDTRGRVIAIVGPNEAGKTSLLHAIRHLTTGEAFAEHEFTDRKPRSDDVPLISALFKLESGDRAALGDLVSAKADVTYERHVYADGDVRHRLRPNFPRDQRLRARCARELRTAFARGWLAALDDVLDGEDEDGPGIAERAEALAGELSHEDDELGTEVTDELGALATAIEARLADGAGKSLVALVETFRQTAVFEREDPPAKRIAAILRKRVPEFLRFTDDDRDLETEYVWQDHPSPPAALAHLFALGRLEYGQFRAASLADDRATRDTMLEAANAELDRAFAEWEQADVHVALSPDKDTLQIMVRDRGVDTRTRLDDRSSGLRSFVALIAFVATRARKVRPVLLIDEAETHLHYAAQADLVRVFERQQAAETVIYTTHSIGCLPEDLGSSVRAITPVDGALRRSTIRNSIWAGAGSAGLTPMMLAMGANALAFTPSRRAVIGEGRCEAILLPTLIRDAQQPADRDAPLGYQVVPGIAEVDPDAAPDLELEAGAVAYLVDGDAGGREHCRKLSARAKAEGRVITLGDDDDDGLSIEDLVDAEVLVEAFHRLVRRRDPNVGVLQTAAELPATGRARVLDAAYREHCDGWQLPKVDLALEALDVGRDRGRTLERSRVLLVRKLHKTLLKVTVRQSE